MHVLDDRHLQKLNFFMAVSLEILKPLRIGSKNQESIFFEKKTKKSLSTIIKHMQIAKHRG